MTYPSRSLVLQRLTTLLEAQVATTGKPFKTISRHLVLWDKCPKEQRPAMYVSQIRPQIYEANRDGVPPRRTLKVSVVVYTNCPANEVNADNGLNDILDAFDAALAPNPMTSVQTLGNLVTNCKINGEVFMDPGYLDGDGLLIVPIDILLP